MNEIEANKEEGLYELKGRLNTLLNNRELPEEILAEVKRIYRKYEELCEEYTKGIIRPVEIEDRIYEDLSDIERQMNNSYMQDCDDKFYEIFGTIKHVEYDEDRTKNGKIEEIKDTTEDKLARTKRALKVVTLVQDKIQESRRELVQKLESRGVSEEKIDEINEQIRSILNNVEDSLGEVAIDSFSRDDEQISQGVLAEYEEYLSVVEKSAEREEKEEPNEKSKEEDAHTSFTNRIREEATKDGPIRSMSDEEFREYIQQLDKNEADKSTGEIGRIPNNKDKDLGADVELL